LNGGVPVWHAVGNPQLAITSLASTCVLHQWQPNTLQKSQLSPSRVSGTKTCWVNQNGAKF